jgi:hypothetical protein
MDFSAKLDELQAKANETVATARAAAAENRDQLKHACYPDRGSRSRCPDFGAAAPRSSE